MKNYFWLFGIVLIIVGAIYGVAAIFMSQYVSEYPNLTFIGLSILSFILVLGFLYITKIYRLSYENDTKKWKSYWNSAELVWLTCALLALLAGMGKYAEQIDPTAYNARLMASRHLVSKSREDISNLLASSEPVLKVAESFCKTSNIPSLFNRLCEGVSSLTEITNDIDFSSKSRINSAEKIYNIQISLESFYKDNLDYLMFIFSQNRNSGFYDDFWDESLREYFDKRFIKPEHRYSYAKLSGNCNNNKDELCHVLDSIFSKEENYDNVVNSSSYKTASSQLKQAQAIMLKVFTRNYYYNDDDKSIAMNLHRLLLMSTSMDDIEEEVGKHQSINNQTLQHLANTIEKYRKYFDCILPLMLGAALGVRFAKGLAAFKI